MKNDKRLKTSGAGQDVFWVCGWLRTGYGGCDQEEASRGLRRVPTGVVSLPRDDKPVPLPCSEIIAKLVLGKTPTEGGYHKRKTGKRNVSSCMCSCGKTKACWLQNVREK